mmetsp:Transcript_3085/g.9212  ORF Transcript_3085/g.9212 Transcript_3085/m.9212 type:complete len:254 (-) Transcript_3085:1071-1832(-)
MSASIAASPPATPCASRTRPRSKPRRSATSARSHSRKSVATWSLRDRPVCRRPATSVPTWSPRRRSLAVWMSSSPSTSSNVPAAHSARTSPMPEAMALACAASRRPTRSSAAAYALEPAKSAAHNFLSNGSELLKSSIVSSVASPKAPPQSFCGLPALVVAARRAVPAMPPRARSERSRSIRIRAACGCASRAAMRMRVACSNADARLSDASATNYWRSRVLLGRSTRGSEACTLINLVEFAPRRQRANPSDC